MDTSERCNNVNQIDMKVSKASTDFPFGMNIACWLLNVGDFYYSNFC